MSHAEASEHRLVCPRCRSETIEVLTTSPVEGVWTMYSCKTCFYAWRSTEPEENTDPDKYPKPFRLKPEDLATFPVVPTIPSLRRSSN
jgi:C4-type Zn-finger protein